MRRLREGLRHLRAGYNSLLKANEMEETLDLVLFRPLAYLGVRAVEQTRITPDQVTLASIVAAVGAALSIATGTYAGFLWGAALVLLFNVLDCADGMLARVRGKGSPYGYILDGLAGYIGTTAILLGIGRAVALRWGNPLLGWSLAVAGGLSMAWWCSVVDELRLEWNRRVYGVRQDRAAELKGLVEAADVWRAEGSHRSERFLVGAYLIYVRLWSGRPRADRFDPREDEIPATSWAESHRSVLRLAVAAGPTMQLTAIAAALVLGTPAAVLIAAVTLGNLWGAVVLGCRFAIQRRLLAQIATEA
ncbi:MAG: CDP-alcohol phosphatidyltransferase family protein [Candidatus Eiseniibacteriota bacterium]